MEKNKSLKVARGFKPSEIKEIEEVFKHPPKEMKDDLRNMMDDLRRGLPPASSIEVLYSRCAW